MTLANGTERNPAAVITHAVMGSAMCGEEEGCCCHEHSHVKDLNAFRPTEIAKPSWVGLKSGKAFLGTCICQRPTTITLELLT